MMTMNHGIYHPPSSIVFGDATVLFSMLVSFRLSLLVCFPFSVQSLLYTPISLLFTLNSLTTIFLLWYRVRGARMGRWGGRMGGMEAFLASRAKLCWRAI